MNWHKADPILYMLTQNRFEKAVSPFLSSKTASSHRLDVIVLATKELSFLPLHLPGVVVTPLLQHYAILELNRDQLQDLLSFDEIIYVEFPKQLFFSAQEAFLSSCLLPVTAPPSSLTGKNTLLGIIDSGLDLSHPAFLTPTGNSRVCYLWDQTKQAFPPNLPPAGYHIGTEYSQEQLNTMLLNHTIPSVDQSGHGSAVAGIAGGSPDSSQNQFRGVAPEAEFIIVKMKLPTHTSFPRTSELMMGVNYCVQKALQLKRPLALNISFGNNYGSHTGESLLETFLDQVSLLGPFCFIVGSGNEGNTNLHAEALLTQTSHTIEFTVGEYEPTLNIQLWKDYADRINLILIAPSGKKVTLPFTSSVSQYVLDGTLLFVLYGTPHPYQFLQEIFIQFLPASDSAYITPGIWRIFIEPLHIKNGFINLWMPGGGILNTSTHFLTASPWNTLTIPSTAQRVITVGAYDPLTLQPAPFSGRGLFKKPDLIAPGVQVMAPAVGGGYTTVTGTSFAAPFVTGTAALLMEWGIVRKQDPFLYGEKAKAYLTAGAKQLSGFSFSPNPITGYGALCAASSFPSL